MHLNKKNILKNYKDYYNSVNVYYINYLLEYYTLFYLIAVIYVSHV